MMKKFCIICGREFSCRPSDRRTTCGLPACRTERKRQQFAELQQHYAEYRKQHRVTVACAVCGRLMELMTCRVGHRQCCSQACSRELRRRNGLAQFGGGKQEVRTCVICGKSFRVSPSSSNSTCSPGCRRRRMSQVGATHDLTEMQRGKRAAANCQPDQRHFAAKFWRLRAPDGTIYEFKNLAHFVRSHPALFEPEHLRLCSGHLYATLMLGALRPDRARSIPSWRGWRWAKT